MERGMEGVDLREEEDLETEAEALVSLSEGGEEEGCRVCVVLQVPATVMVRTMREEEGEGDLVRTPWCNVPL